jgi:hypothetical protein
MSVLKLFGDNGQDRLSHASIDHGLYRSFSDISILNCQGNHSRFLGILCILPTGSREFLPKRFLCTEKQAGRRAKDVKYLASASIRRKIFSFISMSDVLTCNTWHGHEIPKFSQPEISEMEDCHRLFAGIQLL